VNTLTLNKALSADTVTRAKKSRAALKMSYDLIELFEEYQFYKINGGYSKYFVATNSLLQTHSGHVLIDITTESNLPADIAELQTQLLAIGFESTGVYGRVISGFLPIESLSAMKELEDVRIARSSYAPMTHVGAVTSQADTSLNADSARETFDVDGSGVTVGVLSDSFNNLNGADEDISTGDLPGFIEVLEDLDSGGADEGRAMHQLIHDLAPGADLSFTTAFTGQAEFAEGIQNLADQGADIIVDDVLYPNEPFYQDGIIAQAVDQVVEAGVAYFSAVGNNGRLAYESSFVGSEQFVDVGGFQVEAHDFDPGVGVDLYQSVTIPVGASVRFAFQWDSPFFSVSGGNGSPNDLDIFLLSADTSVILASSMDVNVGNDPSEVLHFVNTDTSATEFNLLIGKFDGPDANLMKYVGIGDLTVNEYDTASSTLFGHANAQGAQAVGAASFLDTPAFGTDPSEIEPFSAVGTTPVLFDNEGDRLPQPDIRQKPGIVAVDGTNTTFFGKDIDGDDDLFPNFFGTSAAAPHAAAVAALLKQKDPTLSPQEIYTLLQTTALDMDDPSTPEFDVGFDQATGFGLIQADLALSALVDQLDSPDTTLVDQPSSPDDGGDIIIRKEDSDRLIGKRGHNLLRGQRDDDRLIGKQGRDILLGGAGDDQMHGRGGRDFLVGGDGQDYLVGNKGRDVLSGGSGRDVLRGGLGFDTLAGDRGRDIFELQLRGRSDVILDFQDGRDRLMLPSRLSFGDLSILNRGNGTVIQVDGTRRMILQHLDSNLISEADIVG